MKTITIREESIKRFLSEHEVSHNNGSAPLNKSLFLKNINADKLVFELAGRTTNSIDCIDVFEYQKHSYDDFCDEYKLKKKIIKK